MPCTNLVRHIKQLTPFRNSSEKRKQKLANQENHVLKSPLEDIVIPDTKFLDRLWRDSANFDNHIAIECVVSKKRYTYQELKKNIAVFATSLRNKLDLKPGDVVGVMLPNCPQFPVVALGAMQAGCIASFPVNTSSNEDDVTYQVNTTEPKVFITNLQLYDTVSKGLNNAKSKAKIIIVDDPKLPLPEDLIRYSEILDSGEADYVLLNKNEMKKDDIAVIPFSSGTTDLPKGVEITYGNLLSVLEYADTEGTSIPVLTQGDFQEIVPCIMPMTHIFGFVINLIAQLSKGCKLLTIPNFSMDLYLDVVKNQKPTILYLIPVLATFLAKHPEINGDVLKTVRHIICGAAPLATSDIIAIKEKSMNQVQFNQGYGATETSALITAHLSGVKMLDYGSCGNALPSMKIKFMDLFTGQTVPIGEPGEICVKGPTVMKRYHKNPQATAESFTQDGYFKTGDYGYYKVGYGVFIIARIKDLIKVNGMLVVPTELESLLRSHPAVQDAAVVSIPHKLHGETPKAFVVRRIGYDEVSPDELRRFVNSHVETFKQIEELVFIKSIPKLLGIKIIRKELKAMC